MVGLKQSPNFLSMRLVQLVNIFLKVSSKSIFTILLKSILHNTGSEHLQLTHQNL